MAHMANPIAEPGQLHIRASRTSEPSDVLDIIFYQTQCLTQAAGMLLELPQSATAQANVLLGRFWLSVSPMSHEFSDVSAAAIYIVTKMGSHPRPPRDLSNVYGYLLSSKTRLFPTDDTPRDRDAMSYYQHEDEYLAFHNRILALEPQILYALSFDTHVSLPHPLAVTYLQTLDFLGFPKETIGRKTIEYLNTALLSPQMLYLTHQPHSLATAAIYNAAKDLGAKTPESSWWEVFDVDREELGFLVAGMRSVETWAKAQRTENPALFGERMVTRALVRDEVARRGLAAANGGSASRDDEDELMRQMDQRSNDT
ncbi:cyclin domain-containing protein [Plectosphaerella plurivora]|uniref:Cyclin domain-containing protein n=1 Tax=Plectosphaerella plurivora TaxID=936078 RepID=A0A9P9AC53_9PEZI|nr:cyclin domain-containing protein [Plectosphaerella plurivora]